VDELGVNDDDVSEMLLAVLEPDSGRFLFVRGEEDLGDGCGEVDGGGGVGGQEDLEESVGDSARRRNKDGER
jgi:hypothetical protein